jgi:hypothetical protein
MKKTTHSSTPDRFSQDAFDWPSGNETSANRQRADTCLPSPLGNCLTFATVFDAVIRATVVNLFSVRGPAAILWRIWTVIVDAVETAALWPRAHISVERSEVRPAIADCDPSRGIVAIARSGETAAAHRCPRDIFAALAHAVGNLFSIPPDTSLRVQAAARLTSAIAKCVGWNCFSGSAKAAAPPSCDALRIRRIWRGDFQDGQSAEYLPCQINSVHFTCDFTIGRHA